MDRTEGSVSAHDKAACKLFVRGLAPGVEGRAAKAVLEAAHDPALGLDRSVCLRDVVEWLRREATPRGECGLFPERLPDMLARDFGGQDRG